MPAAWASRLAGPPKSKSHGATISCAPWSISSTAALPTVTGSDLPSMLRKRTGWPSRPPASLICLMATWAPLYPGSSSGAWSPVMQIAPPIRISALAGAASATSPASDQPSAELGRCLIFFPSWSWVAPRRRRAGLVVDPSGQGTCQNARPCKTSRMHRLFLRRPAWTPSTNRIAPSGCKGAQRAILLPFQATALTPAGRCSSSITWAVVRVRQ